MFKKKNLWLIILMLGALFLGGCENKDSNSDVKIKENQLEGKLVIYHAGSLTIPFESLEKEFEEKYPKVDVIRTPGGSRTVARKVTEFGDSVDILCSADYTVIDTLVMPDFANWNGLFAENSMVIVYSKHSQYADEITSENWYEVLTRKGVNYGHSDPNADPCGYRSVLLWQLAENHYGIEGLNNKLLKNCPPRNVRAKAVQLIAMLDTGALDYAFEYESVAMQHAKKNPNLMYVKLPKEINLSSIDYKNDYAKSTIQLDGKTPGEFITKKGQPIVYSLTMPNTGENNEIAIEFLKFLFDKEQGLRLLEEAGQPVLNDIKVFGEENLPMELKYIVE
ncbi:tungstate ABC transporter substrate-binding protein WtpA [Psychrilyobacter atlanticus]|uniref:tungstate ABC transporter substrate-binding protein WtpA n=1 Tax=Psychrilyobacter atlanticus TaxID=271091 RepID=UPI0003F52169|nr:tungstate ABC transporter substrate-binding protein WtpA [Psychrilyobacter atlanticus]